MGSAALQGLENGGWQAVVVKICVEDTLQLWVTVISNSFSHSHDLLGRPY